MIKKHATLPAQPVREWAHGLAYELACEKLAGIADIAQQCRKSGARFLPADKSVIIAHLGRSYRITIPGGGVSLVAGDESVPLRDKILILHYFTRAAGTPLSGKIIRSEEHTSELQSRLHLV